MNKIRVKSYTQVIEVNDEGETIVLKVADQSIPYKLNKLIKNIEEKGKELSNLPDDTSNEEIIEKEYDFQLWVRASIDDVFGKDTCRKVFGDLVPPFESYLDFLEQIKPFFEDYAKERITNLSKYATPSVGSSIQ